MGQLPPLTATNLGTAMENMSAEAAKELVAAQKNWRTPEGRMMEATAIRKHRQQLLGKVASGGDPMTRLMKRVAFGASDCWYWMGSTSRLGYGALPAIGEKKAHRVAYRLFHGDIPTGAKVLHKCDTRCCVNPDHLFIGTQAENVADMVSKGRHRTTPLLGERNPMAKMTAQSVQQARAMKESGVQQAEIARFFSVSPMTISRLIRGESWK